MYFSPTLLVFVLLSSVLAIHPFVLSNPHHKRNHSLFRLQYRIPRALIDTCVSLDAGVSLDALQQLPILEPLLAPLATSVATDLCLCLKDLDIYLGTNTSVEALNDISAILAAVIDTSPDSRQCDLPPNAKRSCTNSDPCRWTCEPNFTREDDTCVCTPPNRLCNGICSESCVMPSSVPRPSKANYKRQQKLDSLTRDAVVYADDSLLDQLANLLKLAVDLKLGSSRFSTSPASYDAILYPVLQSVAGLLTSPQVASLLTNTNNLLDSVNASLEEFNDCNCIIDPQQLANQLEAMLAGTINLKRRLTTDPIGTIGTISNSTSSRATMNNASYMPIVLNLSGLLDSLGLHVDLGTSNDLVTFLLGGLGTTGVTPSGGPLLATNVAINLNTLLDSVLRLVLDTNDAIHLNVSLDLRARVRDIAKATNNYVDSALDGRPVDLELSVLLDLTGTAKDVSEPPLASISLDLDNILDALTTMTQQPPPVGNINGLVNRKALLNDLEVKRLQINTAVKSLGLDGLDPPLLSASVGINL